jgi:hypothetical protein
LLCAAFSSAALADHSSLGTVDYVVHISVDALRGDLLRDLVANTPGTYPNFHRLQTQGAATYNARTDFGYTETVPNHITMITGRPVDQPAGQGNGVHHGYSSNFPGATHTIHANGNPNVPYKSSVFDVVHDNGLSTALYTSKTRLAILDRSYNATNGAVDTTGVDNGRDKIDFTQLTDNSSVTITNSLVADLASATPKNYSFIHLLEPDSVGHSTGWGNAQWNASVATIDSRLGQIFAAIDGNPVLNGNTAIVLTADHGGGVQTHLLETAYENYNIPLFVWGADLPAGSDLYGAAENRFDPALTRTTYDDALQPWRNGDSGNIALALLDLPSIPGSSLVPVFHVPEPSSIFLAASGAIALALCAWRRRR